MPFTKMKPIDHSQVLLKIKQMEKTFLKIELGEILKFYMENKDVYQFEAY